MSLYICKTNMTEFLYPSHLIFPALFWCGIRANCRVKYFCKSKLGSVTPSKKCWVLKIHPNNLCKFYCVIDLAIDS